MNTIAWISSSNFRVTFLLAGLWCSVLLSDGLAQCACEAWPPPSAGETVVYVSTTSEALDAIGAASGKTTIFMNEGVYPVSASVFFNIGKPGITLRSASGNRDAVIIEGEGMDAPGLGHGIYVNADDVTIADLTVREVQNHGFFVNPGVDGCVFHNVRGVDCGEQIFKASGYATDAPKKNGLIECSTFEYTTTLDDGDDGWYTNGIDLLNCHDWIIRDNIIRNIKHNPSLTGSLAGPAILVWGESTNTLVERNKIIECDFGISFGNAGQDGVSHTGGFIRNNFVLGYEESDFGIGLIYAPGATVMNNTVYSPGGWPWSIEARFSESSGGAIMNNFTDEPIFPNRDGASYALTTNLTSAIPSDFVDVLAGDLHLASGSVPAVNAGTVTPGRTHDIDCEAITRLPDVGADEAGSPTPVDIPLPFASELALFPSPATSRLIIHATGMNQVEVFDVNGHLICREQAESGTAKLDLAQQPPGIYFAKIFVAGSVYHRGIVLR